MSSLDIEFLKLNIKKTLNQFLKNGQKIWLRTSKEDLSMAYKHMKRCSMLSLEKWKWKQCEATIHLLEWLKLKKLTLSNASDLILDS